MQNHDFSYRQYDRLHWQQQAQTQINTSLHDYIIREIIAGHPGDEIRVFDLGFGIGLLFERLNALLQGNYSRICMEGCEPSVRNYAGFQSGNAGKGAATIRTENLPFLQYQTESRFDFITAVYVFTHLPSDELEAVAEKISRMLDNNGQFILVVASEKFLEEQMDKGNYRLIEKSSMEFNGKQYWQTLHYSDVPQIGSIIDNSRSEQLYQDLFAKYGMHLRSRREMTDQGFRCSVAVYGKGSG